MPCVICGASTTRAVNALLDLLENDLAAEPQPANLDIKPLTGRALGRASVAASTAPLSASHGSRSKSPRRI